MDFQKCQLCPRACGAQRNNGAVGFCGVDEHVRIARAALHYWEEPCISGSKGSGTVFFTGCNLKCKFCQNFQVSRGQVGQEVTGERLVEIFMELQTQGAHNLNLVTPTHYLPAIIPALKLAKIKGFHLPVVYNCGGYESVATLETLRGLVDVFLPDLKFTSRETAQALANAPDYFTVATAAIRKMAELVGSSAFTSDGIITRGLIVRHLVLPGKTGESRMILKWIKDELPAWVMVSLMGQYISVGEAVGDPQLGRSLTAKEYQSVVDYLLALGLENGYVQELSAASDEFIPPFDLTGV